MLQQQQQKNLHEKRTKLKDKIWLQSEKIKTLEAVADLENFGGGDFKHTASKIRMSSPILRVIFRPESEIQTFFPPKNRWFPKKKKKKVFTEIESDLSAEIGNSNVFSAQKQVVSKKKKKKGLHRN